MSSGLLALLDDVAAIAKMAAASVDDVAGQAVKVSTKSAGVLIDDAAVTPKYVTGLAADRELPIIKRIAMGSLRNKLLLLLPAAMALSYFAPWALTPILMLGGLYLSFEGGEKVMEALFHTPKHGPDPVEALEHDPKALEEVRVGSAIRTDLILSAEIMAITLAALDPAEGLVRTALVLGTVGVMITVLVYGAVALIVRADDFGARLAAGGGSLAGLGRGILRTMPRLLDLLATIGTAAMIWVGGGILLHGAHELGLHAPYEMLHDFAHGVAAGMPLSGLVEWLINAAGAGIVGLVVGLGLAPTLGRVLH